MSKVAELYWDIENMYIEGVSAKRIAEILDCPFEVVHEVLTDMGVADSPQDELSPFETINS